MLQAPLNYIVPCLHYKLRHLHLLVPDLHHQLRKRCEARVQDDPQNLYLLVLLRLDRHHLAVFDGAGRAHRPPPQEHLADVEPQFQEFDDCVDVVFFVGPEGNRFAL